MSAGRSAPSSAQKGEVAATSVKIAETGRAGQYAEAISLAQAQLENLEKKYGPFNHAVAGAFLHKRAIAILEKVRRLDRARLAQALANCASQQELLGLFRSKSRPIVASGVLAVICRLANNSCAAASN